MQKIRTSAHNFNLLFARKMIEEKLSGDVRQRKNVHKSNIKHSVSMITTSTKECM